MEDIDLKELWDKSQEESPSVDIRDFSEITKKPSFNLIERFKKSARRYFKIALAVNAIGITGFFLAGFTFAGIILAAIVLLKTWINLYLYKKISIINYDQGVLGYLTKFRSQLKHIIKVELGYIIFSSLISFPAFYIIFLIGLNGNSQLLPISNLFAGNWGGFIVGEIFIIVGISTKLYRFVGKTLRKVDRQIKEIKN